MSKVQLIVSDPPYIFSDNLSMSDVKRGAMTQYDGMGLTIDQLKVLRVPEITADDAVLALWVPSSVIASGLEIMEAWGFRQTQTFIWVKNKIDPWKELKKSIKAKVKEVTAEEFSLDNLLDIFDNFSLNDTLAFYMGRIFRQAHEIALIGVKGKVYPHVANKSQRSVLFDVNKGHSTKPEGFQDRLELIFPTFTNRLEMFARRDRPGWQCIGLESPSTRDETIDVSLEKIINGDKPLMRPEVVESTVVTEDQIIAISNSGIDIVTNMMAEQMLSVFDFESKATAKLALEAAEVLSDEIEFFTE